MSLATVSIVGNLVRDPEQVSFASGRTKTRIIVAVNPVTRSNRENDLADFYKVEAWGKLAELSANYLTKGNQVTVIGRLVFERWTDKEGRERMTPLVEANQIAFPRRLKVVGATADNEINFEHSGQDDRESGLSASDEDGPVDIEAAASLLSGRPAKSELARSEASTKRKAQTA